jgi:hypothetical protein
MSRDVVGFDENRKFIFTPGELDLQSDVTEVLNRFMLIATLNEEDGNYSAASLLMIPWITDSHQSMTLRQCEGLWNTFSNSRKERMINYLTDCDTIIYDMTEIGYRRNLNRSYRVNLDIYSDFDTIKNRIEEICDKYNESQLFMTLLSLSDPNIGESHVGIPYDFQEMEKIWEVVPNKTGMLKRINSTHYENYKFW